MSFKMDIKEIKIDNSNKIEKRLGINEEGSAQFFLRNEFDRFMDPYIPFNDGPLKNHKTYPNAHSIKYISPYSHYHYIGNLFLASNGSSWAKLGEKKNITGVSLKYSGSPKRGPQWDKRMYADRKDDILRDLNRFIRNGGK